MLRTLAIISLLPLLLLVGPASAATKEQKMETCKFGADDQKLEGAKRKTFIANCMANRNDKRGPVVAAKKPAAKKLITSPPADTAPAAPKQ